MDITVEKKGTVTVIKPHGDIRVGQGDVALQKTYQEQLSAGERLFVLDLSDVKFLDSAGLGELVATLKRVRQAGGDLKISSVNQRVSDALHVTQLVKILDVYEDQAAALAAFL